MSLRKHGLKALGLSLLAALGLMAFSAVGAQAAGLGGEFLIETTLGSGLYHTFKEHSITSEPITGALEELGKLSVATLGVVIGCEKVDVKEATVLVEGIVHGVLLYLECEALDLEGKKLTKCGVQDSKNKASKDVATNEILGLVFLHPEKTGETYVLAEPGPNEKGIFTTVELTGAECAASGVYPITGSTILLVKAGDALKILVNPITDEKLFPTDKLKFGERKATLTGAAEVWLEGGPSKDDKWGAF